jgi:DDE_Tnp_1-associated
MVLLDLLSDVNDPRRAQGQRYPLAPYLLSIVLAVLCGATSFRKIASYLCLKREQLNQLLGVQWQDTPSYGAIRYFLSALDGQSLEMVLRRHASGLAGALGSTATAAAGFRYIALDGKALRGSADRLDDVRAGQIVSAFAHADHLVLGQCEINDKTNEIPVIQQLIAELGLSNCLFTADALHCQKNTGNCLGP